MSTQSPPRRVRRRGARRFAASGAAVATGAMLVLAPITTAEAGPAPTPNNFAQTTAGNFNSVVPNGVCAVKVVATGGAGGSSIAANNTNGAGARISVTYPVTPGQPFSGTVGAGGTAGANSANSQGRGGELGGGDGGASAGFSGAYHTGAGGGGYTTVTIDGTEAVVAGGGGGSGGGHTPSGQTYGYGGNAGLSTGTGVTAGQDGYNGFDGTSGQSGVNGNGGGTVGGGQAGQTNAAGTSGKHSSRPALNGTAGSARNGGNGGADPGADSGAGGGGGYYAGGGGASTVLSNSEGGSSGVSGAGGGGGASFVVPSIGGNTASDISSELGAKRNGSGTGANGSVELRWITCDYDLSVDKKVTGPNADGLTTWTVTVTNEGDEDMAIGDTVTITDTLPGPANTKITSIDAPNGVTGDVEVGDEMKGSVEFARADGSGLKVGESITIVYTQTLSAVGDYENTASVKDRSSNNDNDSDTAETEVTGPTTNDGTSTGRRKQEQRWTPTPTPGTFEVDCADTLTLLDGSGDPVDKLDVPNVGSYTVEGCEIVFQPEDDYDGTPPPVKYEVEDTEGNPATGTYTPTVLPSTPPSTNSGETNGPQGLPQSWKPTPVPGDDFPIDWSTLTLLDGSGNPIDKVTVPGQGTYTVDGNKLVFTPLPTYVGTADPVDYRISDDDRQSADGTYTPTTTTVTPAAVDDASVGRANEPQSTKPLTNDNPGHPDVPLVPDTLTLLDKNGDPAAEVTVPEGVYTIKDGAIVFTPNQNYHGTPTPVDYQVEDANGTQVGATYQPDVIVDPPATNLGTTSGPQGLPQSWKPTPAAGQDFDIDWSTLTLLDENGDPVDKVEVPGQGTYTVDGDKLVFTPEPDFVGTADPVDYRISDEGGQHAKNIYTPTTTKVTPAAVDDSSAGRPNTPQSTDPLTNDTPGDPGVPLAPDTLTLLDKNGDPAAEVTVPEGVYTLKEGKIVFTPNRNYHGTPTPVKYQVEDNNGTPASATYQPEVVADPPLTNAGTTSGPQGLPQSWKPSPAPGQDFDINWSTLTLLDGSGNPIDKVTVPGQGTYTVDGNKLVFTPLPTFVGTADPVDYRISDEGGQHAKNTYTPTTTKVTPAAVNDVSSGWWNRPQSVDPLVNDTPGDPGVPLDPGTLTLLDKDGKPARKVTVPEGVYTIDTTDQAKPRIVFTPNKNFTGTPAPVDYQIADVNGTTAEAVYQPNVRGPETKQDLVQTLVCGTPAVFDMADEVPGLDLSTITLIDKDGNRVDEVKIEGQGTWTVDRDKGTVTFTPDGCYVGEVTPVKWEGELTDGTPVTGNIDADYVKKPVKAEPKPDEPKVKDDDGWLPDAGGPSLAFGLAGLALLGTGIALIRRRKENPAKA